MPRPAYYKIKLNPPPRIVSSLSLNAEQDHLWVCPGGSPRKLEICYLQEGTVTEKTDGEVFTFEKDSVHIFTHKDHFTQTAPPPYHEHSLVLELAEAPVPMTEEELSDLRVLKVHEAIVPERVTDAAVSQQVKSLLAATNLHCHDRINPAQNLQMRCKLYELLALLTEYSFILANSRKDNAYKKKNRYCTNACRYIQQHLHEPMPVTEIAASAGVSYNYLNRMFNEFMGMSLVEYVNRERIRRAEALLLSQGMTQAQVAAAVGIPDVKYLQRLFRRYNGVTITEYNKMRHL